MHLTLTKENLKFIIEEYNTCFYLHFINLLHYTNRNLLSLNQLGGLVTDLRNKHNYILNVSVFYLNVLYTQQAEAVKQALDNRKEKTTHLKTVPGNNQLQHY